jgi:hypothetical protein
MNETNVPDPRAVNITENNIGTPINIDDGGGPSFSSGYDANTLTLSGFSIQVPKIVGCWRINGSFHVHVTKHPNWLHRKMTKLLLGWTWQDS